MDFRFYKRLVLLRKIYLAKLILIQSRGMKRNWLGGRAVVTLAIIVSCMIAAMAKEPIVIPLWPDGAPNSNGFSISDEHQEGVMEVNIAKAELYVYCADKPNGTGLISCPGGGYYGVAMWHEGHQLAQWLNVRGITYAVLRYRMPNQGHYDVPLYDAEQAMRIMRAHAAEWGLNPDKIGIMGFSAGGHLASTLATHYSSPETRPAYQVLLYPVISMIPGVTHDGSRLGLLGKNPGAELEKKFSNELQVTRDTPKAFIAVSADDDLVPVANSLRYFEALTNAGVMSTLHVYPRGSHAWSFNDSFTYKPEWSAELDKWLREEVFPGATPPERGRSLTKYKCL